MNTKTSLRMAVVMLLGTTMQGVFAANPSPTNPLKIASETGTFTAQEIGTIAAFDIPVITNREIKPDTTTPTPSTQPYYVVVTLTGGAKFGSIATLALNCGYTGVAAIPAMTDAPAATIGGTVAGFRLSSGSMTGTCVLTFGSTAVTLTSGVKEYGIKVEARHFDSYNPASATVSGTLISFVQGMQASVEQGKVTVDVSSPSLSKKFLVGGTVTGTAATVVTAIARLGIIKYDPVTDVKTVAGTAPTNATYLGTFTLTVSGAPLAAVQETAAAGVGGTAGIYLSSDKCVTSAAGGALKFASGSQVSFVGVGAAAIDATNGLSVCMIGNDVSSIDRGTVGFVISSVSPATVGLQPNLDMVDTTLVKVEKNGTSLKVLNIPPPDYTTDQAAIRFYNMGTTTGRVTGTLYSQGTTDGSNTGGGSILGSANVILVDSLAPNAVKVLTGPQLGTLFGQTTWPGRAWLQVESEIKGLRVQALIRTIGVNGQVLTNMSDRVMLDGESMSRTE